MQMKCRFFSLTPENANIASKVWEMKAAKMSSSLFPILVIEEAFSLSCSCFPHEGEKTSHFICSVICYCTTFMIGAAAESGAKWPPFSALTDPSKTSKTCRNQEGTSAEKCPAIMPS